ncbi:right-handed parallel beta-helix repeat-containing protein [Nonomuraea bangladeshensis]|uniref:Right-handed parallel beta-helix repeat-containing protein n=1 Tax=Nonomuraea bangladeshensis TaxID=404385 RepID=A0ABV3H9U0_9ACTN
MSSRGNSMFSKTLLACGLGGIALTCALPTPASALDSNYKGETTVACGQVITKSIKLANDLHNCTGNGLEVGAANITIDLNGHTIDGSGILRSFSGIDNSQAGSRNTGYSGVTIKNGTVTDFGSGVTLADGANRNVVQNILAVVNGTGISVRNVDRPHINYSAATGAGVGIRLESVTNARVERNAALYNVNGILLTGASRGTVLYRNSVVNNARDGILVDSTVTGTHIDNNDANGNGALTRQDGIEVDATDRATVIRNNRARNNGDYGIRAAVGVTDGGGNHASGNDAHGPNDQCLNIRCTP